MPYHLIVLGTLEVGQVGRGEVCRAAHQFGHLDGEGIEHLGRQLPRRLGRVLGRKHGQGGLPVGGQRACLSPLEFRRLLGPEWETRGEGERMKPNECNGGNDRGNIQPSTPKKHTQEEAERRRTTEVKTCQVSAQSGWVSAPHRMLINT